MGRTLFLALLAALPAASVLAKPTASSSSAAARKALVDDYCVSCHNDDMRIGNFSLETVDLTDPGSYAEPLEKVALKLRAGMMPPAGMPRPEPADLEAFIEDVEASIDADAAENPHPGRPVLHRLNRTEYKNSIRDLLALDVNVQSLLPPDDMSQGYDNMSDVLTVSPTLLDGYIRAAGKLSRLAVGDPGAAPAVETYVVPQAISQLRHVEGAPFGTRGGLVVRHHFPADADYVIVVAFYHRSLGEIFGDNKPAEGEQVEVAVNGQRVAIFDIDRKMKETESLRTPPIRIQAGPQTISAAFVQRLEGPVQDFVMPFERALADLSTGNVAGLTGLPHLKTLGIDGPYDATGVSETESRRRIFTCRPGNDSEEDPCAREIFWNLARRAFRRPANEGDLERLMPLFESARGRQNFDAGITAGLQAILADPEFLFRFERTPRYTAPGENHRVSDMELASRLSFFLWSSAPDDELITLAGEGKLGEPAVLERQVRRMLRDPRAEALSTSFATHWLHLQNLEDAHPDVYLFPDWDYNLTVSMRRETELLFDSIVREDRSVFDLLTADYTFVDERLAKHYRIPNVIGNRFRRVSVADENRRGLLGQGSILTLTSLANRTSPVIRGAWILDVLLGTPAPRPPANVPPLKENEIGGKHLSVRERLEEHRANPACSACHAIMDPLGYSLENFDAVGAWRFKDSGFDIEPSGELFDGTLVNGPGGLQSYLLRSETLYLRNFTKHLLMYALGRVLQHHDMPTVRGIAREAAGNDHRFSSIVLGIVNSAPFQFRRAESFEAATDAVNQNEQAADESIRSLRERSVRLRAKHFGETAPEPDPPAPGFSGSAEARRAEAEGRRREPGAPPSAASLRAEDRANERERALMHASERTVAVGQAPRH